MNIRVCIVENEPLAFIDENGVPRGFFIDLLDKIALEEHWLIQYLDTGEVDCLQRVRTRDVDLVVGIECSKERNKVFDFTDETILSNWCHIYAGEPDEFRTIKDLENARLAVLKKDIFFTDFQHMMHGFNIHCRYIEKKTYEDVLKAIENGEADAGVVTRFYGLRNGDRYKLKKTGIICCPMEMRFAMPREGPLNQQIKETIDRYIRKWKEDKASIYHKALHKWVSVGSKPSGPGYLSWLLPIMIALVLIIIIINQAIRYRLKLLTQDMREKNEALRREVEERRRIEEKLKEASDRYHRLFDGIQDAVIVHPLNPPEEGGGTIIEVNNRILDLLGYSKSELLKMKISDIVAPERLRNAPSVIRRLQQDQKMSFESILVARDGRRIPVEVTSSVFEMNGELIAISSARDVTLKKEARQILQQRLKYLDGLYQVSRVFLEQLEYEKIIEQLCRFCVDVFEADAAWIGKIDDSKQNVIIKYCCGTFSGGSDEFCVDNAESLSGMDPVTRAFRFKTMQIINDLDDTSIDETWRQKLRSLGIHSAGTFPMIQDDNVLRILSVYSSKSGFFSFECAELFQALANLGAVAFARSELYEQLRKHADELEQRVSERTRELQDINRELERFAYSISHDLKSPLRAVQGFLKALEEESRGRLTDNGQLFITRINKTIKRMDEMIRELLAYSRVCHSKVTIQPVRLGSAVAEVLLAMELEIKNKEAEIDFQSPMPMVLANESILKQAIQNLISNALTFTDPKRKPRIVVRAEKRGSFCRLWVEDNGIGIDPAHFDRIFDLFERLHGMETYPGTGIGLAVVKKGIERMDGRVGVFSKPGEGSRFWLELPIFPIQESQEDNPLYK